MPSFDERKDIYGKPWFSRIVLAVFGALLASVVAFQAFVAMPRARAEVIEQWRGRLSGMADDRRAAIENWLEAGLSDAEAAAAFPSAISLGSSPEAREHFGRVLSAIARAKGYGGGWVIGPGGEIVVAAEGSQSPGQAILKKLAERIDGGESVLEMRAPTGQEISAFFTAHIRNSARGGRIEGFVVFRDDPARFLFPLLQSEPVPTVTGEALVVRADGGDILFLGPLRHRPDQPLTFRVPATPRLAAVAAIGSRNEFGEFVDYRDVPVFAATRSILGAPWGLVVKVDREEALGPYRASVREELKFLAALVLGLGGLAFGFWRSRQMLYEMQILRGRTRFAELLDRAHDPVLFLGPDLRIREVNRRAEDFYGYGRGEMAGLHAVHDLCFAEKRSAVAGAIESFERSGSAIFSTVHCRKDGTRVAVEVSISRFTVEGESGSVAIIRDVEAREQVLAELRRTTATLGALVESSPLAILTIGADERVGLWNPAAEALLGWTSDDVRGRVLPVIPENKAVLDGLKDRVLGGETFAGMELIGRHRKDGTVVDLSLSAAPIRDPGGATLILCIAEDITARRAREAELRKLWRAVEQSPVSVLITDVHGNIEYVNPRFTATSGYSRAEALGKNPRILKSGEMPDEVYLALWQALASGKEWRGELLNRRKDGELYWEDASISPIMDERGNVTNFLAVKEDITARKSLEAQFRQAQKMEAVGRLAGGIAHDFNNLLTVISGYTSLLLRDAVKDSRPEMALGEIEAASKRAAALTQQLLAFGRRQMMQPRPVSLGAVVFDLEKMLRRLIGEDVTLAVSASPGLGTVVVDPGQIEQVLLNLAVNARDAMPAGGGLAIETSNVSIDEAAASSMPGLVPGEYVLLSVRDTGHGIAPEVFPHIFEPFFTTKEKGKGTGLGLATVYGIVKQSGGGIYIDTSVGHGTTFRIYLPRVAGPPSGSPAALVEGSVPGGSETIMLVEDEDGVRNIVTRLLEDFGYRVIPIAGPLDAIARLSASDGGVALVLTDVVMPHMDGRTMALRMRKKRPGLKFLFMTGYTPDETMRAGIRGDGSAVLQKPFRPEQLARRVREALDAPAAD